MAVMKQMDMALRFDLGGGRISVRNVEFGGVPVPVEEETADEPPKVNEEGEDTGGEGMPPGIRADTNQARTAKAPRRQDGSATGGAVELSRRLDGVTIRSVEIQGDEKPVTDGSCSVIYETNGTCTPYTVQLEDENGSVLTVRVDALSTAETEAKR